MRVLGIDEAGRGCVLGPLVIGGFVWEGDGEVRLREAGAADSKRLSPKRRLEARDRLMGLGQGEVREVSATQIDGGNLNHLEEEVIVSLVKEVRPQRVMVDALGHPSTVGRTIARLRAEVGLACEWVMEPKADATYAVVGAASIFAKTHRDARLDALREAYGILGSGYPSDPKTRSWLAAWGASGEPWPDFVRTRWGTIEAIRQQSILAGPV